MINGNGDGLSPALKLTNILRDGALEFTGPLGVSYLIDIQGDGNRYWYVRYSSHGRDGLPISCSHLDALLHTVVNHCRGVVKAARNRKAVSNG